MFLQGPMLNYWTQLTIPILNPVTIICPSNGLEQGNLKSNIRWKIESRKCNSDSWSFLDYNQWEVYPADTVCIALRASSPVMHGGYTLLNCSCRTDNTTSLMLFRKKRRYGGSIGATYLTQLINCRIAMGWTRWDLMSTSSVESKPSIVDLCSVY